MLNGSAVDATVSTGITLPLVNFSIHASNDVSNIVINTNSNIAINRASLAAQVKTFSDGISVLFHPSSFVLNGKTWSIEQGGELNLRQNAVTNGQVILKEGPQEIRIATVASDIGTWNDLQVTLQSLNLGDLSPLFLKDMRLEGTLSGNLVAENPTGRMVINGDLRASEIKLDNDSIGNLVFNGQYNNVNGMLTARGNNLDPEHKINFDLAMDFNDSADAFQDRITLRPDNFHIRYLERFVG
ncbi:MAG: hypothetical protein M3Q06_05500, partial [Bacteroidota bacterium]|nr:hypothetical protein [Bacteroidota bacterium]